MFTSTRKKPSFTFILMVLFAVLKLASTSSIKNEEMLSARVDSLQAKLDQLIIQLEEEKIHRTNLQALNLRLESRVNIQEEEIRLLKNRNINEKEFIKPKSIENNVHPDVKYEDFSKSDSSTRQPPSSCRQLSTIGHYLDGIYLVANPDTNKIETVYCEFGSSTLSETLFGIIEVKTKSVYFYVQRSIDFNLTNVVVPFDIEILNVGGAMNTASGVFTAPVDGIYHFEFSALKMMDSSNIFVHLQVNGVTTVTSYATGLPNYLALTSINSYIRLKTGDQVWMYKKQGTLRDDYRYTQFAGQLVEEDLILD